MLDGRTRSRYLFTGVIGVFLILPAAEFIAWVHSSGGGKHCGSSAGGNGPRISGADSTAVPGSRGAVPGEETSGAWPADPAFAPSAPIGGETAADPGGERVGSEFCAECHDEVAQAFRSSVHWKKDPERSCENCHGPGGEHVEEVDPEKIFRFLDRVPAIRRSAACLECHGRERSHNGYRKSDHALASVACDDCHNPHGTPNESLLREGTPALCYECHTTVRSQFSLNEHHPVDEGGIACTDCHDPHRRASRSLLGGFKQQACLRCHSEYRGPWVFEHEAVTVEGCTACHTPHGSVNRHLLAYQRVGDLCLQCHPEQPFFHDATDASGQRTTEYNDCTRCHSEIHGSNSDALFLN